MISIFGLCLNFVLNHKEHLSEVDTIVAYPLHKRYNFRDYSQSVVTVAQCARMRVTCENRKTNIHFRKSLTLV